MSITSNVYVITCMGVYSKYNENCLKQNEIETLCTL